VFEALRREPGIEFSSIVVPAADDRLALAARAAGLEVHVLANPKIVPAEAIAEGTDLIVAAHTHARISNEALARARHGGIGYHPSLLPRHRGIAAVEWTILEGDPIAGGSIYLLADGWDAGALAAQDWCFVAKGENARELWERALAPMGLELLGRVVRHVRDHDQLPVKPQDLRFATKAPMIRRSLVVTDDAPSHTTALVITVIGPDRRGIVSALSECAERHSANWTASRMARLAGEFAGMVHFDVPRENADALADALRGLETAGLRVAVSRSDGAAAAEHVEGLRSIELQLIGDDRKGIVSALTRILASNGVSIENMHTEISGHTGAGKRSFKVVAHLLAPAALSNDQLRTLLEGLAHQMMLDLALDDRPKA
jgi:glycine cleavage system regulatory protein/folate-dependent phosphoribosylglycinamide formyltransferase PurN